MRALIVAGAPHDHVNNLGWTAVIESIVLGDGGPRHVDTLRALVDAGADVNVADRARGCREMVDILSKAGARWAGPAAPPALPPRSLTRTAAG